MDWDLVRFFLAAAHSGSLAASAVALGVSQPTVGRKITELEERLHCALFLRSTTGLTLTDDGMRFIEKAMRIRDDVDSLLRLAGQTEEFGKVRITASEGLGLFWVLPMLAEFNREYPNIETELIIDNKQLDMARGESDIALRLGDSGGDSLFGRRIASVGFGMFASEGYLATAASAIDITTLADHKFVGICGALSAFSPSIWFKKYEQQGRANLYCSSLIGCLNAVEWGLGIGLVSCFAAQGRNLVKVMPDVEAPVMPLWLLVHPDNKNQKKIIRMMSYISSAAKKQQSEFH
jgi:DNA-binding transcriptional LysR family regulator